ncbi:MAG: SH3 domain-containing protein, partial [Tissierellia bacterium]|nr:SH3 domain-containing protein [Tissierellia bacterium]
YDCSSLVITVLENAGIPVKTNGATFTGDMYEVFLNTDFKDVTSSVDLNSGEGLKKGDVLLAHNIESEHTEIYIGNGEICGARSDEEGGVTGNIAGDQRGDEIAYSLYKNKAWDYVLRYVGENSVDEKDNDKEDNPSETNKAFKVKNENWYGITLASCNVRTAPSTSAQIVAVYEKGERINYDQVWQGDGYRWISYVSWSGNRRYVAYRSLKNPSDQWIRF